jgi:hypothetical protein
MDERVQTQEQKEAPMAADKITPHLRGER